MSTVLFAIPAFNEAATIAQCVTEASQAARRARLKPVLVVADDDSTDDTAHLAREAGAYVIKVHHRQISAVRNAAAVAAIALAGGDALELDTPLIFVDGDTLISQALLEDALAALRAGAVGGGARTAFDERTPAWATLVMKLLAGPLLYWHGYAGGCFLYCRLDAFHAIGGFDEAFYAGEEIHFLKALKKLKRGKVRILRASSLTSGRKIRQYSPWRLLTALFTIVRTRARTRDGLEIWYSGEREDVAQRRL